MKPSPGSPNPTTTSSTSTPSASPRNTPASATSKAPAPASSPATPSAKTPADVWIFPNVKHNHVEKTEHPCQYPVELVERLVLSLTDENDLVVDPYMGVASTAIAALRHNRRTAGAEIDPQYHQIGQTRIQAEQTGQLRTRPMHRPVYQPSDRNDRGCGSA